jgi:hypothetical protein
VVYAGLTWIGTQFALNFAVVPFALMEVQKVWYFYKTWYFVVPITAVVLALTLNGASTKSTRKQDPSQEENKTK